MRFHLFAIAALVSTLTLPMAAQRRVPKDLSSARGFNYQSAETIGHAEDTLRVAQAAAQRIHDSEGSFGSADAGPCCSSAI